MGRKEGRPSFLPFRFVPSLTYSLKSRTRRGLNSLQSENNTAYTVESRHLTRPAPSVALTSKKKNSYLEVSCCNLTEKKSILVTRTKQNKKLVKLQRVNRRKLSFWQLNWKDSEIIGFFRIKFSIKKKEETKLTI